MSEERVRSALRMVRTTQKVKMADGRGKPVCVAVSLAKGVSEDMLTDRIRRCWSHIANSPPIPMSMKAVPAAPLLVCPWFSSSFSGVLEISNVPPIVSRTSKGSDPRPCRNPTIALTKLSSTMASIINNGTSTSRLSSGRGAIAAVLSRGW